MTLTEYKNYFKSLSEHHSVIKDFCIGGSERILNRMRSEIRYPICWLEYPDIGMVQNGGTKARFSGAFSILFQCAPSDWDQEDADLDQALQICLEFIERMVEDEENGELFEFDPLGIDLQMKEKYADDNDHGWRVSFDLVSMTPCLPDQAFDDDDDDD